VGASLSQAAEVRIPEEGIDFEQVVAGTERRYLQAALAKADGVRTEAAQGLKISYRFVPTLREEAQPLIPKASIEKTSCS